ncbi:hypothetical protein KIW84_024426 [Lathyrus oleraceus]|uniref:Uncharacterized protein n=1 Tax=Pisum sativum TaxID=3888 RepID=A0A9D4YLI3_PEA|nr:hypothetical protein KIW84_024426 [Pisum sativum]
MLGFGETTTLGKYLGVPLTRKEPRKEEYRYIIDQMNAKLALWKGGGRLIWGDNGSNGKHHVIKWDVVTSSKNDGGIWLSKLDITNKACISKLGWKLQNRSGELWCDVVWGKYNRSNDKRDISMKPSYSTLWKSIIKEAKVADIGNVDIGWNWEVMKHWLPHDMLQQMATIMPH